MAHNTRIRAAGLWTLGSDVTPGEFEAFDLAQFESINGDQGGVWAPFSQIEIGGAGLKTTGAFAVAGSITFDGQAIFEATSTITYKSGSNTLVVAGAIWDFANLPTFSGGYTVTGGAVNFAGAVSLVEFDAPSRFDGAVNFATSVGSIDVQAAVDWNFLNRPDFAQGLDIDGGTLIVKGAGAMAVESGATLDVEAGATLLVNGNFSLVGSGFISDLMAEAANGHWRYRVVVPADTAGGEVTLGVNDAGAPDHHSTIFRINAASAAGGTYKIKNAALGDWMILRFNSMANTVDVVREDDTIIRAAVDGSSLLWIMHNGTQWGVMLFEDAPGATF